MLYSYGARIKPKQTNNPKLRVTFHAHLPDSERRVQMDSVMDKGESELAGKGLIKDSL